MSNKGFTLIELLVTIMLLAIVMSIGAYSIVNVINASKDKNYDLLIKNIKNASETYYEECKYANNDRISCNIAADGTITTTLGNLVKYGYLTGNGKNDDNKYDLFDPNTNKLISNCQIKIKYNKQIIITKNSNTDSASGNACPSY